jgi:exodeoxyribonuclease III
VRIVSWNILDGGVDKDGAVHRQTMIRDVVKVLQPDIVVLQEANGFERNNSAVVHELASAWGMRGTLALAPSGFHVASFHRRGLRARSVDCSELKLQHAVNATEFVIKPSEGGGKKKRLLAASPHLAPFSGDRRLAETSAVLSLRAEYDEMMMIGDMNTVGAHDRNAIYALSPERRKRYVDEHDAPDSRPLTLLRDSGFVDLAEARGQMEPTVPTPMWRKLKNVDFSPIPMRLDYCFATTSIASKCVDIRAVVNALTDRASDHYPVVVDFAFELERDLQRSVVSGLNA